MAVVMQVRRMGVAGSAAGDGFSVGERMVHIGSDCLLNENDDERNQPAS